MLFGIQSVNILMWRSRRDVHFFDYSLIILYGCDVVHFDEKASMGK